MPSTQDICGDFAEPELRNLGTCTPLRMIRNCEVASVPALTDLEYDPDSDIPFTVI